MSTELIPVFTDTIGASSVNTVDGRTLHAFLEVRSEFRNWIKSRIDDFSFTQGIDFIAGNFLPGSERIDYHLTLDMAKELAMVERNAKGKEARLYFIECERRLIARTPPAELTREQILVMALDSERERGRLAKELDRVQPMVQFHEEVAQAEGEFTVDETCAALFNGAVPAKELRNWLKHHGWLDQRAKINKPTEWAIHRGFMRLRLDTVNQRLFSVPVLTGNGLEILRHLYRTQQLFTACIPVECLLPPSTDKAA